MGGRRRPVETYVTQRGDGVHGQQHVPRLVQQPGPEEIGIDADAGDERERDDPLQTDGLEDLACGSVTEESVGEGRVEGSTDGHGQSTAKVVRRGRRCATQWVV